MGHANSGPSKAGKREILAIIPARGGSKGIPRKNIVNFLGKPLISYSISHALESSLITRVVVSTEDEEIAKVSAQFGAEIPFFRPQDLAGDTVLDLPVFEHVLRELNNREGYSPEIVVHLRPTAPYRKQGWIDSAIETLIKNPNADSIRSVSAVSQHPYRMFRIGSDKFLDPIMKHEHDLPYQLRRQDLPPIYFYNCVIDVTRPSTILAKSSMTGSRILPFVMDADDVMDIDSARDLEWAAYLMKAQI